MVHRYLRNIGATYVIGSISGGSGGFPHILKVMLLALYKERIL